MFKQFLNFGLYDYCHLDTTIDEWILLGSDNSLRSVYEIVGIPSVIDNTEFTQMIDNFNSYRGNFAKAGFDLQFIFIRDKERSKEQINKVCEPVLQTVKTHHITLGPLMDKKKELLAKNSHFEKVYLSIRTKTSVLSKADKQAQSKKRYFAGMGSQSAGMMTQTLITTHQTFCDQFEKMMRNVVIIKKLPAAQGLRLLKTEIDMESTSEKWSPAIPENPENSENPEKSIPIRLKNNKKKNDYSHLYFPLLAYQLHTHAVEYCPQEWDIIKVNGRFIAPLVIDLPPSQPDSFDRLYQSLSPDVPIRLSIRLQTGHDDIIRHLVNIKKIFASILAFTNARNKNILQSIEQFKLLSEKDTKFVSVNIAAVTWGHTIDQCRKNRSSLIESFISWGNMASRSTIRDDSVAAWAETLPCHYTNKTISARFYLPLTDAFAMIPLYRPASLWNKGQLQLTTIDGKFFPLEFFSAQQKHWCSLVFAPPGSGKSVLLMMIMLGLVLFAGQADFPYLTVLDANPSSKSFVDLMKAILPQNQKHLAQYIRIKNTDAYRINIFDTPLGFRYPTSIDYAFLQNFLTEILTPAGNKNVDNLSEFVDDLIPELYQSFSDKGEQTKIYNKNIDLAIDQILEQHNLFNKLPEDPTWWEITDLLAEKSLFHEALLSQRHAVPSLIDLNITMTKSNRLMTKYEDLQNKNENFIKFVQRMVQSAIHKYPMLLGPSSFSLGDAKFVVINLQDVLGKGSEIMQKKNTLMYMFAMQVSVSKFFRNEESFLPEVTNPIYYEYHKTEIRKLVSTYKGIFFDEYHRSKEEGKISRVDAMAQIYAREGRKYLVSLNLFSQRCDDFNETLRDLSSNIFILSSGKGKERDKLQNIFGYNNDVREALEREVKEPGTFLLISELVSTTLYQILRMPLTAHELWSVTSVNQDAALRERLLTQMEYSEAIQLLTRLWPKGTSLHEYKSIQNNETDHTTSDTDIINLLVRKVLDLRYQLKFIKGETI